MQPLSVVIITFNEEKNIGRCLDSVRNVADEIIVLDSYSDDNTAEIAAGKGASVHLQKFQGYGHQKNDAIGYTRHDMVLSLDADEALSDKLAQSIMLAKENGGYDAYSMNRCTNYCGRFIRHGSWYPDKKIRLFNKKKARWDNSPIHEKVEVLPGTRVKHLSGDILHYSFSNIAEHVSQNNRFSTLSAQTLFNNGKRTSLFKVIVNPWWAFILSYFVRLGFADGFYGFIVAVNISHLTFLKHSKLMTIQRESKPTNRHNQTKQKSEVRSQNNHTSQNSE